MLGLLSSSSVHAPVISATRIYLRYPHKSDFEQWQDLRESSKAELIPFEPKWQEDETQLSGFRRRLRIYERNRLKKTGHSFFIFTKQDDILLGGITLSNIRFGDCQTGSLGYWLGTAHTKKGYMLEALISVGIFGFKQLGLNRLEAACIDENTNSHNLLKKAGYMPEGKLRSYFCINGAWRDHTIYAKLASDPILAK